MNMVTAFTNKIIDMTRMRTANEMTFAASLRDLFCQREAPHDVAGAYLQGRIRPEHDLHLNQFNRLKPP